MNTKTTAENDNAARIVDLGNNESLTVGLVPQRDGTFMALTSCESKTFTTHGGAERWLAMRGYAPNGARLAR